MTLTIYIYIFQEEWEFGSPKIFDSSPLRTLLAKQIWRWELMLQGERSLTRRWWCCNFDKWSNWSWETPLHSTLLVAPSSPTLQAEEGAEQSWKEGVSKILCNQPAFLVFILLLFPFPSFLPRKRGPAVKWCNPDAVTMLLSVNHQGCDLRRKKKVYVFHELKVVLICIWRKRKTPQLV